MSAIQSRKFGWVRTASAYESVTAWSEKRKVMRQEFEQRQSAANDAFTNAWSAQIDGAGTLIGQIALARVIAEGKAKSAAQAESDKLATDINSSAADLQDSMFSGSCRKGIFEKDRVI